MEKSFRSIDQQVRLLQGRRVMTDADTPAILLREGYYAVVNGYGKAFLDHEATRRAGDDRYLRGTRFSSMYRLFLFDRELRAITFRSLMCVEGTLRSLLAHSFCERHPQANAYLDAASYCSRDEYLRGATNYASDVEWMINTLSHHASGHAVTDRNGGGLPDPDVTSDNVRVAWYRDNYDAIPLWVLFSDLTFGNLRYFFALMRRGEQKLVCKRLGRVCGAGELTPRGMLADLEALSDLRNDCAHVERIYDGRFGPDASLRFPDMVRILGTYLAADDESRLARELSQLVHDSEGRDASLAPILAEAGFGR